MDLSTVTDDQLRVACLVAFLLGAIAALFGVVKVAHHQLNKNGA